jgi:hypothetical protein
MPLVDERGDLIFTNPLAAIPVNIRQYVASLMGDEAELNEKHLSASDLESLKRAVLRQVRKTGQREGEIGYGDYYETPAKFSSFARGESAVRYLTDSFNDPAFRMETTLGMARYKVDDAGNAVVEDKYDFNATREQVRELLSKRSTLRVLGESYQRHGVNGLLNVVGNIFGRTEGEGTPVKINLGPINAVP